MGGTKKLPDVVVQYEVWQPLREKFEAKACRIAAAGDLARNRWSLGRFRNYIQRVMLRLHRLASRFRGRLGLWSTKPLQGSSEISADELACRMSLIERRLAELERIHTSPGIPQCNNP